MTLLEVAGRTLTHKEWSVALEKSCARIPDGFRSLRVRKALRLYTLVDLGLAEPESANLREKRQRLYGTFSSRDQFRTDFARNLAHAINELRPQATNAAVAPTQSIEGDGNVQIGGDLNRF